MDQKTVTKRLGQIDGLVLSNPWFGVGGLERVYLAITSVKTNACIVAAKNFHDATSFKFYFGEHKPFPRVFDIDLFVDGESPYVHMCMNAALRNYFVNNEYKMAIHVTNHWGLFFEDPSKCQRKLVYFQPGVWEMEQVAKNDVLRRLYRDALQESEVLANSTFMKDFLKERFGCDAKVLYPCTDTLFFSNQDMNNAKEYDVMIFSRLNAGKQFTAAIDLFAEIAKKRPATRFLIAGAIRREDISFLDELKAIAARRGLTNSITFVPNPSLQDLKGLYARSRLLAFLPKNEPLGLVPVEAMVAGVPVVAFKSGGAAETVIHGKTGMLCTGEADIVDAITGLLDEPDKIRDMRGKVSIVSEKFSEHAFLENLLRIIEK
nr:glycosyltransferase family 4 protein [Candidatus Sigynarchaeota archaeon]